MNVVYTIWCVIYIKHSTVSSTKKSSIKRCDLIPRNSFWYYPHLLSKRIKKDFFKKYFRKSFMRMLPVLAKFSTLILSFLLVVWDVTSKQYLHVKSNVKVCLCHATIYSFVQIIWFTNHSIIEFITVRNQYIPYTSYIE